jgi:hypothetical protein
MNLLGNFRFLWRNISIKYHGILKNIFYPSKDEIWGLLEKEINATLLNKDSFWHESKVVLEHKIGQSF